jgi:hypothetical protein
MGMFDEIRCEMPLPDNRLPPGTWFQTKSLVSWMSKYTISQEGRLIYHFERYEAGPNREIAEGKFFRSRKLVETKDLDTEFHGDVRFYTHNDKEEWLEYVARFTNGTVE